MPLGLTQALAFPVDTVAAFCGNMQDAARILDEEAAASVGASWDLAAAVVVVAVDDTSDGAVLEDQQISRVCLAVAGAAAVAVAEVVAAGGCLASRLEPPGAGLPYWRILGER